MKTTKKHTVNISISLPRGLRNAARQAALVEQRSVSGLIAILLKEHLCAEGYLEAKPKPSEAPYSRMHI